MFTATMPVWIGVLIIVPLVLIAIAVSLIAWLRPRDAITQLSKALVRANVLEVDYQNIKDQRDKLNRENESLHTANKAWAEQNTDLHAKNADLREALTEALAEIKSLNMRTIEIPEVVIPDAPMPYSEAKPAIDKAAQSTKRPARGNKKAGQA